MRTINEILTEQQQARVRLPEIVALLDAAIAGDVNLAELTSTSKVADFREWEYVMSACSFITEALWEESKAQLTALGNEGIAANQFWFKREWKKFQYGDTLLVDDTTGKYYYPVIDETKQIIKRLSIVKGNFNWIVKVAKEVAGVSTPLTLAELNAFRTFVDMTQPPGPKIPIVSLDADLLDSRFTVFYNPITPIDDLQPLVETAYNNYIDQIDLELDSLYYISKHVDSIQKVSNVVDVVVNSVKAKENTGVYADVARVYAPLSGYLRKDPALDLSVAITYVAAI